jgi:hypothetical protein
MSHALAERRDPAQVPDLGVGRKEECDLLLQFMHFQAQSPGREPLNRPRVEIRSVGSFVTSEAAARSTLHLKQATWEFPVAPRLTAVPKASALAQPWALPGSALHHGTEA